jgi:RNase adaptor protein for sRNA GlmZ degradation
MITLISWGFKFGRPPANIAFDVSFLKNPWREKELQGASKEKILEFMEKQKEFSELIDAFFNIIKTYNALWPKETLVFAFCCSAGEYRSPAVVEALYKKLTEENIPAEINHSKHSKWNNSNQK